MFVDANRKELLESPGRINKDMDVVVSAEIGRQEKITEEMLHLTRSLKENMSTANQLVKRDFKVLVREEMERVFLGSARIRRLVVYFL